MLKASYRAVARIAVIATSFNRRRQTLAALGSVFAQELPEGHELEVFLVDDASTDGTGEAVRTQFPQVHLIRGTGSLFWCGGMRTAWSEAFKGDFDYYLWINDDIVLEADALYRLVGVAETLGTRGLQDTIVVGSTYDLATGLHTYGGVVHSSRIHPLKFKLLAPSDTIESCHTMNGNCVLVTRATAQKLGGFSPAFTHSTGDYDYGLRARAAGCTIWLIPGYVGTCSRNSDRGTWLDRNLPLHKRWEQMRSPKGLVPREYREFVRQHGGPLWPIWWVLPYVRLIVSSLLPTGGKRVPTENLRHSS